MGTISRVPFLHEQTLTELTAAISGGATERWNKHLSRKLRMSHRPFLRRRLSELPFRMSLAAPAIDPQITMAELLRHFPGAQRAMFRKYHIGGCSACGFSPEETLAGVCRRNENLPVEEVIEEIVSADAAERAMQIEPNDLAAKLANGEPVHLLDVRTREEFETVKIEGARLFTQDLLNEISAHWPKDELLAIYDHRGDRALDAAAYFQGHGFTNARVLRGGIDAWSQEVDPKLPRYHLE